MPTDQILATEEMVGAGHATKSDTLNRALNKLTTAGDLMYATAAQTVARLGIGTANFKLFTNAGATAPEWASGLKVLAGTRDMTAASGDVAYTGVGFKPAAIIAIAGGDGTKLDFSAGMADAAAYKSVCYNLTVFTSAAVLINLVPATGKQQSAILKTFDADGFTLTWTKAGSPDAETAGLYFLCLR